MSNRGYVHISLLLIAAVGASALAWNQRDERRFWALGTETRVVPPSGIPEPGNRAIATAMALFAIKLPPRTNVPEFNPELEDRGLTVRGTWLGNSRVTIGPSAFESWGILGSTLAHEVEVHCNQSFALIVLMDMLKLDGTGAAERQAYLYEIKGQDRFHLSRADRDLIVDTMTFYYPADAADDLRKIFSKGTFERWIAGRAIANQ